MPETIIQGEWDDLVNRHDLHGRTVRIIVLDEKQVERDLIGDNPWLRSLRAWADRHAPLGHPIDDSRDSIYSGTVDDPR
jgi:hypothetical protein